MSSEGEEKPLIQVSPDQRGKQKLHGSQHECCASRPRVTDQGICIREHL